jgi:hypothetical protein
MKLIDDTTSTTRPTSKPVSPFLYVMKDPAVMEILREGRYRVIWNEVGVSASHVIWDISDGG